MKKKMPAWTVLMIICLCSGLLLAVVNMLTADRIAEQKMLSENATRAALFPEAKDFGELELQESRFNIANLYSAKDGSGSVIGYVGQSNVNGYGGEIAVTTAVDTAGVIRGISVGGDSFAETPGLGALTKEAAFTDQFQGKKPDIVLNQGGVDTVAGASTSSRAVVSGVNAVANYIYTFELGLLEESTSNYDGPITTASAQGFGGEITVNAGFAEDGSIAYLAIDTPNETDGLGKMASEPSFTNQFIGKKGPFAYGEDGIDAIAGATITSNAVISTLNGMINSDGGETGEMPAEATEEPAAEPATTEAYDGPITTASAQGFGGEITVNAGFAEDGSVAYLAIDTPNETAGLGQKASDATFTGQFIGKKGPFTYGEDGIDAIAGATITSNAVISTLNGMINSDGEETGETPAEATEEPAAEPVTTEAYNGPITTATVQGFGGEITINAGFAEDGSIAYLSIDTPNETAGLGQKASEADFTDQFIGKKGPFTYGIDAISGATITSNAVLNTLNAMITDATDVSMDGKADAATAATGSAAAETEEDGSRFMRIRPEFSDPGQETDARTPAAETTEEETAEDGSRFMRTRPEFSDPEQEADAAMPAAETTDEETAEDGSRFMRTRPEFSNPGQEADATTPAAETTDEETTEDGSRFMRERPELTEPVQDAGEENEESESEEPDAERMMRPRPSFSDAEPGGQSETPAAAYVLVSSPTQTGWLPLPTEGAYSYHLQQVFPDGTETENVIHLTPDGICMESSTCDNQDCVFQGMVTLENRYERILSNMIICLPNQVFLQLYSREEALAMISAEQNAN